MNKDLVSLIITSFKRPEMIEGAVSNCLRQSYVNIEIIVIDDNGLKTPDQIRTEEAMQAFSNNEKVTYIALDNNRGSSAARNFGAGKSKGSFLAFFDDDDEWAENKIELQYQAISGSENNPGMVFCSQKIVDAITFHEYMRIDYSILEPDPYRQLLNTSISFATPNPLIRKSAFLEVGGFKEGLPSAQDLEFGLRMTRAYNSVIIKEICLISKVHSGERISANHLGKIQGFRYILENYDSDMSDEGRSFYWQRILMHCFLGRIKAEAKESLIQLKRLNSFTIKYRCFYLGIYNPLLRWLLQQYLKMNKALYKPIA